jgi:hypothetical protein
MRNRAVVSIACVAALFAANARAVQEDLLVQARALVVEAKPLMEAANDTDLPMEQRRSPRKQAFTKLKHARELFDQYLDIPANASMEEKLDKEYTEIVGSIFWLKKDSGLGELEKDDKPAAPEAPPPDKGAGGEKPAPKPAAPPSLGPEAPAPNGEAPSDFAFRAKNKFAAITTYEKAHAGDLPYLKNCYEQFLADFSDPSLPEYAAAVEKLGKVNDRLRTVLKEFAKRDPDTIKTDDSKAEKSIFGRLTSDLGSKDPETRRRAARLMAAARVRSSAHFLARGLTDADDEVAKTCREGLIGVGGRFVGEKLVEFYRDASKEKQQAALDVLAEIVKKGPVDAAAQSASIGHFVLSNESDVAVASLALLTGMGKIGGPGLMFGLDSKILLKKTETMKALAQARYYRAATTIADRYLGTKVPPALRNAAMDALKTMGKPAVPYMISVLSSDSGAYTSFVLREMTGDPTIIIGDEKKVRAWCNAHKDEIKDE